LEHGVYRPVCRLINLRARNAGQANKPVY